MISSRLFYINSISRLSGTPSHFSYLVNIPKESGFDRAVVLQANIPVSYYIIQQGYNEFIMIGEDGPTPITIPIGNYSATSFATTLSSLMTSQSQSGYSFTVTFPNAFVQANTGKFTFAVSGNTMQPSVVMTENSPYEQLGFDRNSTNTFVANKLISSNVVSFIPETNILLHSDIVDTAQQDHDILQTIMADNSTPMANAVYHAYSPEYTSKPLRTNQANVYWFSLTDENNKQIDLNGVNCVFTLLLYKKDNTNDMIRNYLKWRAAH